MRFLLPLLAAFVAVVGCSAGAPSASPTQAAPTTAASVAANPSPAATFSAEDRGLQMAATFDRLVVPAGEAINVSLTLHNGRTEEVRFEEPCDTGALSVDIPNPVEPIGRGWDGIAAAFKTYGLEESAGTPIESSIRTPLKTVAKAEPCHARTTTEGLLTVATLAAGATYENVLTWTAELVRGLPAGPGEVPFSIQVRHGWESVAGGMFKTETLAVTGTIEIQGGSSSAVSAGQALDAALQDAEFSAWLEKQPRDSWENVNLFLQPGAMGDAVGPLPAVPYWDVELYRAPRNWAVVLVDAAAGTVLTKDFCNNPCDR